MEVMGVDRPCLAHVPPRCWLVILQVVQEGDVKKGVLYLLPFLGKSGSGGFAKRKCIIYIYILYYIIIYITCQILGIKKNSPLGKDHKKNSPLELLIVNPY